MTARRPLTSKSAPQSVCSDPFDHQTGGCQNDFDVQQQRPFANVLQIEPHHFFKRKFAAAIHLPEPGDTGIDSRSSLGSVRNSRLIPSGPKSPAGNGWAYPGSSPRVAR